MKHLLTFFCLSIAAGFWSQSNVNSITASSEIKNVTVFISGAEVHRRAKVTLNSGSNEIIFEHLSPHIDPNSIQVKANNSTVTIVSVNHQTNFLKDNSKSDALKKVQDSLEDLRLAKSIRKSHEKVYLDERSMILANKSIGGAQLGVNVDDLMDVADYYREHLLEIEMKLIDVKLQLKKINTSIARLQKQEGVLKRGSSKSTKEIVVNVSSKSNQKVGFEISYVVNNAGWVPKYDIRSNDIDLPVSMSYKADVYNLSGFDWENVNITLSSGNPTIDNTQPNLSSWYLRYYQSYKGRKYGNSNAYKQSSGAAPMTLNYATVMADKDEEEDGFLAQEQTLSDFTTMIESTVSNEFKIALPYTIKSDGKPYLVEIQEYDLPVDYQYFAIPKLDKDAFLLARIAGWGSYNLLPGEANVYFEGTYVGTSFLETNSTNDTLEVSLGRDKSIVIQRKKVDELCKNTTLGGNKKTSRGYEIKIKNNKSKAIEIEVLDQVPLSSYKEVEIELEDQGGSSYKEKTGELNWKISLAPQETKEVNFQYQVKYPKGYNMSNL